MSTPCEKLGYKVGDKFKVIKESTFTKDSTVELEYDDMSSTPLFKLIKGECKYNLSNNGTYSGAYLNLYLVEKLSELTAEENNMITCKEDLIGTYVLTSDKEVLKLFIEACEEFDISWVTGDKASELDYSESREMYRVNKEHCKLEAPFSLKYTQGYKQLTLADFIHSENALQSPVDNVNIDEHMHTLEENKRSTGAPMPFIVEDGSVSDTRKDFFKEILTLARENDCFIQFDGFASDDAGDSIVVTFASSDDEFVVQSVDEFRELVNSINTTQKFLRGL